VTSDDDSIEFSPGITAQKKRSVIIAAHETTDYHFSFIALYFFFQHATIL
jgi:hypothetical protein